MGPRDAELDSLRSPHGGPALALGEQGSLEPSAAGVTRRTPTDSPSSWDSTPFKEGACLHFECLTCSFAPLLRVKVPVWHPGHGSAAVKLSGNFQHPQDICTSPAFLLPVYPAAHRLPETRGPVDAPTSREPPGPTSLWPGLSGQTGTLYSHKAKFAPQQG